MSCYPVWIQNNLPVVKKGFSYVGRHVGRVKHHMVHAPTYVKIIVCTGVIVGGSLPPLLGSPEGYKNSDKQTISADYTPTPYLAYAPQIEPFYSVPQSVVISDIGNAYIPSNSDEYNGKGNDGGENGDNVNRNGGNHNGINPTTIPEPPSYSLLFVFIIILCLFSSERGLRST